MISITWFKVSISLLFLVISGYAGAAVSLRMAEGIELLAINGELPPSAAAGANAASVTVNNGVNQLLVQYGTEMAVAGGEQAYVRTDTFVLLFDASDSHVALQAPRIKRQRDLKQFNRAPLWQLLNAAGEALPLQVAPLKKEGFQLNRDYPAELAEFNRGRSTAVLPPLAVAADSSPPRSIDGHAGSEAGLALTMLKYWYQKADRNSRRQFQHWIGP